MIGLRKSALVLLLTAMACDAPPPPELQFVATDSAGLRIATTVGLPPRFDAPLHRSLGSVSGDEPFSFNRITSVEIVGDNLILVLDTDNQSVKAFSTTGEHLYSFGRRGEGPAEFQRPTQLGVEDDDVWVFDWRLQKIADFDLQDGTLRETLAFPYSLRRFGFPFFVQRLGEGRHLIMGLTGCQMPRSDNDDRWRLFVGVPDLGVIDTIADLSVGNSLTFYGENDSFCGSPVFPFGATPVVAARDGRIALAYGTTGEVLVSDFAAPLRTTALFRYSVPTLPVLSQDQETYRETVADADRDFREAFHEALDERGFPPAWPSVAAILIDGYGRIWTQRGGPAAAERIWDVLDVSGQHTASVSFPSAVRILAVDQNFAVGVRRDELDVQFLDVFDLAGFPQPAP